MKKLILPFCLLFLFSISSFSQHAINAINIGAVDYVEVGDNPNASLDINTGFTAEAWILTGSAQSNQKVMGKIAADFQNGFILGIQDGQVNFEVFDDNGVQTVLQTGVVPDTTWTHVSATYEVGGMMYIYVNGQEAGGVMASTNTHDYNTNPFRIGIAPWDVNALGFFGYIDEVRYWNNVMDEATIRDWMHKDLTMDHPNYGDLGLYHKYDEGTGELTADLSGSGNDGTLIGAEWLPSTTPFKGTYELYENQVRGVWLGQNTATSDILTLTGSDITADQSVVFANSDQEYDFITQPSSGFEKLLAKTWRVTTQQMFFFPTLEASFDLSPIDMTGISDMALLMDFSPDFTDPTAINGTQSGNTFVVPAGGEVYIEGAFFTLGFNGTVSNQNIDNKSNFIVSPNPGDGRFQVKIDHVKTDQLLIRIMDVTGKILVQKSVATRQNAYSESYDCSSFADGIYLLQLIDGGNISSQRIVIDKI